MGVNAEMSNVSTLQRVQTRYRDGSLHYNTGKDIMYQSLVIFL